MPLATLKSHLEAAKRAIDESLANVATAEVNPEPLQRRFLVQALREVLEAQRELTAANKVLLPYGKKP